jgi:hypothetical protein
MSGTKPLPMHGPIILQTYAGFKTSGLKLAVAGTRLKSDDADILTTTLKKVVFDPYVFPSTGAKGIPRDIMIKAVDDVLFVSSGDGIAEYAADTWTPLMPCTDIFLGNAELHLGAAAESDIQFKIFF